MEVRLIGKNDAALLAPLLDAYRQFYEQTSDEAGALAYLQERLPAGDCFGIVAINESGGDESGLASGFALVYPTYSSVQMKPVWTLNDFFVAPTHRGSGLAEQVMTALFALAQERGISGLNLITHTSNERAQAHYKKMGWSQSEYLRFEKQL